MLKKLYKADQLLWISKQSVNRLFIYHSFRTCIKTQGCKPCLSLKYKPFVSQLRFIQSKNIDYYKVLGVKPSATAKQIKKMFYEKSKKLHPDSLKTGSKDTTNEFIKVQQAYEILSNTKSRHEYDSYRRSSSKQTHTYDEWKSQGMNSATHRSTYSNVNTSGVHGMKFEQKKEENPYDGVKTRSFWFDISVIAAAFGVFWIMWKREMEMSSLGFGTFYNEFWKGFRSGPRETYDQMVQQRHWSQKKKGEIHNMDKHVTSETFGINPYEAKKKRNKKSKNKSSKKKKSNTLSSKKSKESPISARISEPSELLNSKASSVSDKTTLNDYSSKKVVPLLIYDQSKVSEANTDNLEDKLYIDVIEPVSVVTNDQTLNKDELIPLSDNKTMSLESSNLSEPNKKFSTDKSVINQNDPYLNVVELSQDDSSQKINAKDAIIENTNNLLEPIDYKNFTINLDDLKTW